MALEDNWNTPIDAALTLGEVLVLHAALTQVIAEQWAPEHQEDAYEACHKLLGLVGSDLSGELCDRLLSSMLIVAPELRNFHENT